MNIVLLQAASGPDINGPVVRVPPGNYKIEKSGSFKLCDMLLNEARMRINSSLVLSNHSSIKLFASEAENLTVRLVRTI